MKENKCPWITLQNGVKMPKIGFGLALIEKGRVMRDVVDTAIEAGYRLFDNAPIYGNEDAFGEALRNNGVKREEVFISSKLRNSQHRYEDALKAFDSSRKALGVDYLDMYMIHFPCPEYDLYCEAWRALEHLYQEGSVRAIGVSNFHVTHLEKIFSVCEIQPAVNELECNPYLSIAPLREYCRARNIWPEAWFPLGGPAVTLSGKATPGKRLLEDELLISLGEKYGKSTAQIVLRWHCQSDIIAIPKSAKPHRIRENIDIFDFELSDEDMAAIDALNCDRRVGSNPDICNDQF
jgi:diketogulonate reductase-like aldo/keto reductase